jgi:hypothetical protein
LLKGGPKKDPQATHRFPKREIGGSSTSLIVAKLIMNIFQTEQNNYYILKMQQYSTVVFPVDNKGILNS